MSINPSSVLLSGVFSAGGFLSAGRFVLLDSLGEVLVSLVVESAGFLSSSSPFFSSGSSGVASSGARISLRLVSLSSRMTSSVL